VAALLAVVVEEATVDEGAELEVLEATPA